MAFSELKSCFATAPILAFPDCSRPFLLDTDVSQSGIGTVLSQEQHGKECVIAYASCVLLKAERQYSVTCKGLLAVVVFI